MDSVVIDQEGRSFYLEINPDLDMGELPSIFYTRYKDYLPGELALYDIAGNVIPVEIEKGYRTAVIVKGYRNISIMYDLLHGGWLSLYFVGGAQFLITDVKDHNMLVKGPSFPPFKVLDNVYRNVGAPLDSNMVVDEDGGDYVMVDDPSSESDQSWVDVGAEWVDSLSVPVPKDPVQLTKGGPINICCPCGSIVNSTVSGANAQCESIKQVLALGECKFAFDQDKLMLTFLETQPAPTKRDCTKCIMRPLMLYGLITMLAQEKQIRAHMMSNTILRQNVFVLFIISKKVVTYYQATAYSLIIPTKFAARAFPSKLDYVTVVSANAPNILMKIRWRARRTYEAFLTRGWKEFVGHHGLRHGSVIRMFVPEDDESVMYVAVVLV